MKKILNLMLAFIIIISIVSRINIIKASSYNVTDAINYANQYALNYNPNYSNYNSIGGDCANFVSQCLHAGGLSMDSTWYWYSYSNRSSSWSYCPSMISTFAKKGFEVIYNAKASQIKPGNPVLYYNGSNWAHAAICVGYDSKGIPLVNAHNNDRKQVDWQLGGSAYGWTQYCTIIINKSNVPESSSPLDIGTNFTASIHNIGVSKLIKNANSNVETATETCDMSERWKFDRQSDGSYKISNLKDGLVLDDQNFGNSNGSNVIVASSNDSDAQRWFIYQGKSGYLFVPKCAKDKCLDVAGGSANEGANIQIWEKNNTPAQEFSIWKVSDPAITNVGNDFYASIIQVSNWKPLSNVGDNVCFKNLDEGSQTLWHFQQNYDGSYIIKSAYDGKALTAIESKDGGNVATSTYNGKLNQKWYVLGESGKYKLRPASSSEMVLDLSTGIYVDGVNAQVFTYNGTDAQEYQIWEYDYTNPALQTEVNSDTSEVKFSWWRVNGMKNSKLKIWAGNDTSVEPFYVVDNITEWKCFKTLPSGTYTAQVEVINGLNTRKSEMKTVLVNTSLKPKITLNKTEVALDINQTFKLIGSVDNGQKIKWSSIDSSIATIDANGNITAKSGGTTYIKATSADGLVSTTCKIVVKIPVIEVKSINLDKTTLNLNKGESYKLSSTITPDNATDKNLTWTSSNSKVAIVENGVVKAIGAGTATITVKTSNGKTATCQVTVKSPITGVTLDTTSKTINKGSSFTLKATINPSDTTDSKTLTWTSSNNKVATVENGVVKAVGVGTATITVKTSNGKTATCQVTVKSPITGVALDTTSKTINKGSSFTLKATINPSDTTDSKTLTWTSSNSKVATVSNGVVKAIGAGTATITVKTSNGKTATCQVTVKEGGSISTQDITTKKNQTISIPVYIQNNPGIIGLKMEMSYDTSKLQLISVDDNGLLDSPLMSDKLNKTPYILSWGDGLLDKNNTSTGKLVTVKFKVLDVSTCDTTVTFKPTEAYGTDLEKNILFLETKSTVKINNRLVGDVNGDGEIKLNDALLLRRYVADYDVKIVKENADVNGDGEIKLNDALLLRRYTAGWDVQLK